MANIDHIYDFKYVFLLLQGAKQNQLS